MQKRIPPGDQFASRYPCFTRHHQALFTRGGPETVLGIGIPVAGQAELIRTFRVARVFCISARYAFR